MITPGSTNPQLTEKGYRGVFRVCGRDDQQGKVVKTWPEQPELLRQDWSDTPHFLWMQKNPARGAFHDLKTIESNGKEILCNSISMNGPQNEFVGAAYYCYQFYPITQNAFYKALIRRQHPQAVFLQSRLCDACLKPARLLFEARENDGIADDDAHIARGMLVGEAWDRGSSFTSTPSSTSVQSLSSSASSNDRSIDLGVPTMYWPPRSRRN
jgi:hypothetical protein